MSRRPAMDREARLAKQRACQERLRGKRKAAGLCICGKGPRYVTVRLKVCQCRTPAHRKRAAAAMARTMRPVITAAEWVAILRMRRKGELPLPVSPEPVPYRRNDERVESPGRKAGKVSCVRCPHCRVLLHVGNIAQRRYRDKLVKAGRCVVCTHDNPDRRYRVCPTCRQASRDRAKAAAREGEADGRQEAAEPRAGHARQHRAAAAQAGPAPAAPA